MKYYENKTLKERAKLRHQAVAFNTSLETGTDEVVREYIQQINAVKIKKERPANQPNS